MTLTIEGEAVPQGRPRFTRNGHAYDPERSREYKEKVALAASLAMRGEQVFPRETPLRCIITVWKQMPKRFNQRQRALAKAEILRPTVKPDIDNMAKAITDAMNGIVYADDSQIVELVCGKYYDDKPGVIVTVEPMPQIKEQRVGLSYDGDGENQPQG